jgi:hypothetical protein
MQRLGEGEQKKRKRAPKPEAQVKKHVKKAVADEAPEAWGYMPVQGPSGQHGIPDHVYCVPVTITPDMVGRTVGLFVGVEDKAEEGRLSALQQKCHDDIRAAHGLVRVVRGPQGVEEFKEWLRALTHAS